MLWQELKRLFICLPLAENIVILVDCILFIHHVKVKACIHYAFSTVAVTGRYFFRKAVLKSFGKFTGKHLLESFFDKVQVVGQDWSTNVFLWLLRIFSKQFFIYRQWAVASGIWQNLQGNGCAGVSFLIKLQALGLQLYLKNWLRSKSFLVNFAKFFGTAFSV